MSGAEVVVVVLGYERECTPHPYLLQVASHPMAPSIKVSPTLATGSSTVTCCALTPPPYS